MRARHVFVFALITGTSRGAPAAEPASREPLAEAARPAETPLPTFRELIREVVSQEERAQKELEDLSQKAALAYNRTLARGRSYVRLARAGLLPAAGGFEAMLDHVARLSRLRNNLALDLELERQLAAQRRQLTAQLKELTARRSQLEREQQALQQAEAALVAERERGLAFERAFTGDARGASLVPQPSSEVALLRPLSFAAQKGKLPLPVPGRVELAPVRLRTARIGGIELRCTPGVAVKAVYGGRVAFADSYADYGRTVILDHGGGFYTLTGLMAALDVRVGDSVHQGSRLGSVETQGRLYFEVRMGTNTVDAAEWLGISR